MRRRWPWQDNPVLLGELVARLRSWDAVCLHALFLVACCAVVVFFWPSATGRPLEAAARAQTLRAMLVTTQYLLGALVASVIAAPLIAREKEQGTYELLISSPLEPGTLIFGKMAVALTYVLLLQLSVLPVLVALTYLGGIGWQQLVGDAVLLASTTVIFATLQFEASVRQRRVIAAQITGVARVLAVSALLAVPLLWRFDRFGAAYIPLLRSIGQYTVPIFAVLALGRLALTYVRVRPRILRPPDEDVTGPPEEEEKPVDTPMQLVLDREKWPDRWLIPPRRQDHMPDGVNPVFDRELRAELFSQGTTMLRAIIYVSASISVVLMGVCLELFPAYAYGYCWFLLVFLGLVAPALGAGSVASEYERRTFDLLRCTRLRPGQVLLGKMMVAMRTTVGLLLLLTVVQVAFPTVLAWLPVRIPFAGFVLALLLVYLHVPVVVSQAFVWSVLIRKSGWATLAAYGTVFGLYGGVEWLARAGWLPQVLAYVAPFHCAYRLIASRDGVAASDLARVAGLNLVAWGAVCAVCVTAAFVLFRRRWRAAD